MVDANIVPECMNNGTGFQKIRKVQTDVLAADPIIQYSGRVLHKMEDSHFSNISVVVILK